MEQSIFDLVSEFRKIEKSFSYSNKKETTLFDVAGFPHYENVASNVLKFFLDTNNDKEHGFGNLWLKAVLNAYNQKSGSNILLASVFTNDVKREYSNGADKRIDLLIDMESMIVVIENKIFADIYNDLNVYTQMAKNYKNTDTVIVGIVLSLSPLKGKEEYFKATNYVNTTYEEIFAYIEDNWEYDENNKWQLLAKDFITNIRQLKGIMNMKFNQDWLKFVGENGKDINRLIQLYNDDLDVRLNLLRELDKAIDDVEGIIRHGVYNSSSERYISEYIDVTRENNHAICIETYLMKEYSKEDWERFDTIYICVWARKNKSFDFTNVLNKLKSVNPKMETTEGWGKHYILKEMRLNYDFDIQDLKDSVAAFVKALLR